MKFLPIILALAAGGSAFAAPNATQKNTTARTAVTTARTADKGGKSLYDRLGGEPAIKAVVDDFVKRAAADKKVDFFRGERFKHIDVATLEKHLVDLIGSLTGGPQTYTGRDMKSVHKGEHMSITDGQFNALAGDLAASLDKFKVPAAEKGQLMAKISATRADIVEAGSSGATTPGGVMQKPMKR